MSRKDRSSEEKTEKMKKKMSEKDWEKFLEQEYIEEADRMEQALRSDDSVEVPELTDEEIEASYARLVEKLKQDGIYREDGETAGAEASGKIRAFPADGAKEEKTARSFRAPVRRAARIAGLVLVCVLGVFAASMTSEANRKYFIESVRYLTGNDARIIIKNDSTNDSVKEDEYAAIAEIEEKLGVEMPEFFYIPKGFIYYDYEVNPYADIGRIEYIFQKEVLSVFVMKNENFEASGTIGMHGDKIEEIEMEISGDLLKIRILQVQDEGDVKPAYVAQWQIDETFYHVIGKVDKSELERMVKSMKF